MSIVAVGGSAKGVGKTALICGILARLPELEWTAIKITSHAYRGVPITEEVAHDPTVDTGRYLLAGARRALLVEANEGVELASVLREVAEQGGNLIVESNRIALYLSPDLCLGVIGKSALPEKLSFAAFVAGADALAARSEASVRADCRKPGVRFFAMADFSRISPEFEEWLRARLSLRARWETARS